MCFTQCLPHQFKLSIWRNKADTAFCFKFTKLNTLKWKNKIHLIIKSVKHPWCGKQSYNVFLRAQTWWKVQSSMAIPVLLVFLDITVNLLINGCFTNTQRTCGRTIFRQAFWQDLVLWKQKSLCSIQKQWLQAFLPTVCVSLATNKYYTIPKWWPFRTSNFTIIYLLSTHEDVWQGKYFKSISNDSIVLKYTCIMRLTYFLEPKLSEESEDADFEDCFSTTSLSFIPNLHSGIPDKKLFMTTRPDTWALRTCPVETKCQSWLSSKSNMFSEKHKYKYDCET